MLSKEASLREAVPGEAIQYLVTVRNPDASLAAGPVTVSDTLPAGLQLRPASLTVDGSAPASFVIAPEGRGFTLTIPSIAPGATAEIRYAAEVRGDAREGDALNLASATDSRGVASNVAEALVRIRRDPIAGALTIIGRVTDGGCGADAATAPGIAGVRIMLEDGRYAVTDIDGRYHFEGVQPGTHVVQLDEATLPADRAVAQCARNTRSAGRAFSRFVEASGRRADAGRFPRRRGARPPDGAAGEPARGRRRRAAPRRPAPSATGWPARSPASAGCSRRKTIIRARRSSGSRSSICPARRSGCSRTDGRSMRSRSTAPA